MRRREVLKAIAVAIGGSATGMRIPIVNATEYTGKFVVFVQLDGGWDPTCFCDPKENTPGEPVINHWAEHEETRHVGNIRYAPFADNVSFFEKYHQNMLVINGVDAQTNSHTTGVVHNCSGRAAEGYPTLSALLASQYDTLLPMAYLSFGGYSETAGLTRFTRLNNTHLLSAVANPRGDKDPYGRPPYFSADAWDAIEEHRTITTGAIANSDSIPFGRPRHLDLYRTAMRSGDEIKAFTDAISQEERLEKVSREMIGADNFRSALRQQSQLAVLAFRSGTAVSADLHLGGFDTHARNDTGQEWLLRKLVDGIDYLWSYAERHDVADRLLVVLGSDFGRTNFYNADDGKDHWPIGSFVVMEKNQTWTDRVVGITDELHFAQKINPRTLERDDMNGTIIYPKHVHKALRRYLDIEATEGTKRFPFNNTEDFAFFDEPV